MARIAAEGARMLSEIGGADLRADLIRFIAEAVERLPAGPVEVHVAAASLHLAETAADDPLLARHRTNITRIVADESVTSGCVVQTLDGRIRFDNSYEARARRSEAVWRARLGQLFERDVMAAQRAPLAEAAR
jgi:vacuolar-type H+-ATPase subunit E/Vma4